MGKALQCVKERENMGLDTMDMVKSICYVCCEALRCQSRAIPKCFTVYLQVIGAPIEEVDLA